ncbi:MAG: ATP-binding cassette domain-containing protein [Treponema sp.]
MMLSTTLRHSKNRYTLFGCTAAVGLWQILALIINQPIILPRIEVIGASIYSIISEVHFFQTTGSTIARIAVTIVFDTIFAFIFGIVAGISERCEAFFTPFETAVRAVPTMGVLLISLIWFRSEVTPIFVSTLIALPILYRGVVNGVKNIDSRLKIMSDSFCVPFFRALFLLYLPAIRPSVVTAYSTALGLLVKVMVTAEVLSQPRFGIGTEFQIARAQLDTAAIFAWSCIVIGLAAGIEYLNTLLHTVCCKKDAAVLPVQNNTAVKTVPPAAAGSEAEKDCSCIPDMCGSVDSGCSLFPPEFSQGSAVSIENLSFSFGNMPVFTDFSHCIAGGEVTCILGKSGRGKTTLLFLIAGLLVPQKGTVKIAQHYAGKSFAYQDLRLIPHLTAEENIRYVLPLPFHSPKAVRLAFRYLAAFGLAGFEHFLPHQLSGGMQRRVSLARALAYPSGIILLDEAFDSLDAQTKESVSSLFFDITRRQKRTAVCVTHDAGFARTVADTVIHIE